MVEHTGDKFPVKTLNLASNDVEFEPDEEIATSINRYSKASFRCCNRIVDMIIHQIKSQWTSRTTLATISFINVLPL